MKKIIYLTLLLVITCAFSQKSLIDERNGFKSIKLGTPLSSFPISSLFYTNTTSNGLKSYMYFPSDKSLYYVFDSKYDFIFLYFNKEVLEIIEITKNFTGDTYYIDAVDQSTKTRKNFLRIFGKYDEIEKNDYYGNLSVFWYGTKAFFSVGYTNLGIIKKRAESNVIIGKTIKLNSGF